MSISSILPPIPLQINNENETKATTFEVSKSLWQKENKKSRENGSILKYKSENLIVYIMFQHILHEEKKE